ncbi:MAG: ATP-binding protein [Sedimentisphaeraceae bacterium JB056]
MISRTIEKELLQCAKEYPAVTIFGPRQSGKTTLARLAFPDHQYYSLEDVDHRRYASEDPRGLVEGFEGGVIFDEIQRVPELLSYLQGVIDENPVEGRFILTGSHQPRIQQSVSQSLAGRTAVLELLPFSVEELAQYKRNYDLPYELIFKGFYPRLHENELRPSRFYASYFATYVERDIRELINLKDLKRFHEFMRLLAGRVGQLMNYNSLAGDVGVSSVTIKDWISVLKASYLIFELPPFFRNIRKRLVKMPKIYFTDVGLACWLLGIEDSQQLIRDPLRGNLYENMLVVETLKQIQNRGLNSQLYFYRDSHGNEVDLVIAGRKSITAIEMKSAKTFHPDFFKGLVNFEQALCEEIPVDKQLWYAGKEVLTYKDVSITNPLNTYLQGGNVFD